MQLDDLRTGLDFKELPAAPPRSSDVPHAPRRTPKLTQEEFKQAVRNHLRYFPSKWHAVLAEEFAEELRVFGHIYCYRFRPHYELKPQDASTYPCATREAACIMHMIHNNLSRVIAQFPEELITYGGNGSVFSNWAQYRLAMKYLCEVTDQQTLVMYSGHPHGLFPSSPNAPRVVVTNGMVIPNYSSHEEYQKMYAMGVSQYGQMTAGSFAYIGPQGIVHGTTLTILNAGRKFLGTSSQVSGKVYVSSGLGGMSGAQAKAAVICGAVGVIAEVDPAALDKRHAQGWVQEKITDLDTLVSRIKQAKAAAESVSIGFLGNVVSVWERLAEEEELLVDMGSDQTSLHNPFNGGYYPVQLSFEEGVQMIASDPAKFKELVQESLRRHIAAVNKLTARGMKFWDYGNSFLLESSRAGAAVMKESGVGFIYPSYVEDIMGDIFSLGFGPFRWVCCSGEHSDLQETDRIAAEIIENLMKDAAPRIKAQYEDNLHWIKEAEDNQLVVGSEARILYSGADGRIQLALAFNEAIKEGRIKGPVVLSRDHHDVSGTDSPFRETSDIRDGSMFCADMAVHNVIGDAFRGATWISLHNGGGVGWGEVVNGGFGMVLKGDEDSARRAKAMLYWDVNNGVTRRAWAGNDNANFEIRRQMEVVPNLQVTVANFASDEVLSFLDKKHD